MRELVPGFSEWVRVTLKRELRRRALVVRTEDDETKAAQSLADVQRNAARGEVVVWTGASDNTIFDCPESNWAMRALHDLWHLDSGGDFDLLGEVRVHHHALDNGLVPSALADAFTVDGIGQSVYHTMTGRFPEDQRKFTEQTLHWYSQGRSLEEAVREVVENGL